MRRDELEHVIRAAASVAGENEIVVVGSQAILGQFPDAPDALLFSQEADVYPRARPAGRERDMKFAEEAIRHDIVQPQELLRRVGNLPVDTRRRQHVRSLLKIAIAKATRQS
jgi:hypothetical protein